ncbi:hypothetical protein E2C01_010809 [Portunus trituberculatus]|uniref:Uncharacterized protein n=1 Tax=Portunus trituberculatus TaxID=210409 RepID=A0A5B7D9E6_PORTR|nr:hypothetical protein [Portunus trituberculatus]
MPTSQMTKLLSNANFSDDHATFQHQLLGRPQRPPTPTSRKITAPSDTCFSMPMMLFPMITVPSSITFLMTTTPVGITFPTTKGHSTTTSSISLPPERPRYLPGPLS